MSAPQGSGDNKGQVLAATDIVELIRQSVSLTRRGKDFVGLCPFHQEKTPSFSVSPTKQFFHCYGCKASGNAIDFVMKRDRIEFLDALKFLAQRAGIDLPRYGSAEAKEKSGERQMLIDAHSAACSLFEKFLADHVTGKSAREYLSTRGFTAESIQRFQIGFVPEAWDALLNSPAMKRFPVGLLQQAGLIKAREGGNGHYDTFRNRLMFPIRDEAGRIIAFGGRAMPGSPEEVAKYLNSPETPLFSKGKSIFGLDLARQEIVQSRTAAVVEGYTDVVMAHQFGATNVVSILGTAMTEQHVKVLRRFADRIVLLFDADDAGELAVNRAVELFLTQPVEIAIAAIPEALDPDEFLLKYGLDAFKKLLADAGDALTYKWAQLGRRFKATTDLTGQQKAVEQYLELLAAARGAGPVDSMRWGAALSRVSRLTRVPLEDLQRRFRMPRIAQQRRTERTGTVRSAQEKVERRLLGALLAEPARWHDVQQHVAPETFSGEQSRRLAQAYWNYHRDEGEPSMADLLGVLEGDELKEFAASIVSEVDELGSVELVIKECMEYLDRSRFEATKRSIPASIESENEQATEHLRRLTEMTKVASQRNKNM